MTIVTNSHGCPVYFEGAAAEMDAGIRQQLEQNMPGCTAQEFFTAHCERHREVFGQEFLSDTSNPNC